MIHQLVFGYDDGHRLLSGSQPISASSLSQLLGATDATPGSDQDRLVTGLPLLDEGLYALCFTWSAPEVTRPGAVWAHVLLLEANELGVMPDPFSLSALARRPRQSALQQYSVAARADGLSLQEREPPSAVLEASVAAAYAKDATRVVLTDDLAAGEEALAVIWRSQWPELRQHFAFRTRDAVRETSPNADIVIARRVRGIRQAEGDDRRPAWVGELSRAITHPEASRLAQFVSKFGPAESPSPLAVGRLAEVFMAVSTERPDGVRQHLERAYPSQDSGIVLKGELFGAPNNRWWIASEEDRVLALLGAAADVWNVERLRLSERVAAVMSGPKGPETVSASLREPPVAAVQSALVAAIVELRHPKTVGVFAKDHVGVAAKVLRASDELANHLATWRGLSTPTATALLRALKPVPPVVIAKAVEAGQEEGVLRAVDDADIVRALAHNATVATARRVLSSDRWAETLRSDSDECVALLSAVISSGELIREDLVSALEARRGGPSELWLRAAVFAVSSPVLDPGSVLEAVFGPLHNAMTTDTLPRDCWRILDPVLPRASDPALRLRRYLIRIATDQHWSARRFNLASRDAGPFGARLLDEMYSEDDDDGWWVAAARAVLRGLGVKNR